MSLREIGTVARLQVQRSTLVVGEGAARHYDLTPLVSVPRASVSVRGIVGLLADETIVDVHHADRVDTLGDGENSVSLLFTPSYARMRERFGDHVFDGSAGENILIETSEPIAPRDLEHELIIRCGDSEVFARFESIVVAHPCVNFSRYALRLPQAAKTSAEMKATLQFLDQGTRGFYATAAHASELTLSLGDRVYLPVV
jgi:hypothetical protein